MKISNHLFLNTTAKFVSLDNPVFVIVAMVVLWAIFRILKDITITVVTTKLVLFP